MKDLRDSSAENHYLYKKLNEVLKKMISAQTNSTVEITSADLDLLIATNSIEVSTQYFVPEKEWLLIGISTNKVKPISGKLHLFNGEQLPTGIEPDVLIIDSGIVDRNISVEGIEVIAPENYLLKSYVVDKFFADASNHSIAGMSSIVPLTGIGLFHVNMDASYKKVSPYELIGSANTTPGIRVFFEFHKYNVSYSIPIPQLLSAGTNETGTSIILTFDGEVTNISLVDDMLIYIGAQEYSIEDATTVDNLQWTITLDPLAPVVNDQEVYITIPDGAITGKLGGAISEIVAYPVANNVPSSQTAPTIGVATISAITDESFTIASLITPNGGTTVVTLEYGRKFLYENSISFPLSPIEIATTVSVVVPDLPFFKDCNWRIKAENSVGTTYLSGTTKTLTLRTTSSVGDPDYYVEGQTFYIDPTVETSGNGSIGSPWKAWANIVWNPNRIYLIKRGTTLTASNFGTLNTVTNVTIAGYGTGNRPILHGTTTSSSSKILDMGGAGSSGLKISGLEIRQAGTPVSTLVNIAQDNTDLMVEYCFIHNGTFGIRFRANNGLYFNNATIKSCVIEDIVDDGIYAYRVEGLNIFNTLVHRVNTAWVTPETSQTIASGDAVQLILVNNYLIQDCVLDRSDSGNKFAFIQNSPGNGIIEFSELISPIDTEEGGAVQYSQAGNILITRDCVIRGNSSDPSTSMLGMYHNNTSGIYTSQRNKYINLPMGIYNLAGTCTSEDDEFINCTTNTGGVVEFV